MADLPPVILGAAGLTGRQKIVRGPVELEEPLYDDEGNPILDAEGRPVFAQPPSESFAIPPNCLRVLNSPLPPERGGGCNIDCPGKQRDGSCLCDIVREANSRGVAWSFEIDRDGYWVYDGPPLNGITIEEPPLETEVEPDPFEVEEPESPIIDPAATHLLPGTIAVTADEVGRFTRFAVSMQGLEIPGGSRTLWLIGNDIAGNRNAAAESMTGEWLWFIDDDHAFHPDILVSLLRHEVDIVAPVVLRRVQPFETVTTLNDDFLDLSTMPGEGLIEVEATGSSGMLIRREVIEGVEEPWFELGNGISEDINFCRKARAAGFRIHVDLGAQIGHLCTAAIWPVFADGRWYTGFNIADGFQLTADIQVVSA